jgi:uncharacterized phage protein (TIGR02218 family)
MKIVSDALQTHLGNEVTSLSYCWRLNRRDGTVLGFTNHDRNIAYEGVTYHASGGFTPTAIENATGLSIDNMDIEGMLNSTQITEVDIMAGRYDFAEISLFMLNTQDTSQGVLQLRSGWLGEVKMQEGQFVAEVRGLTQRLSQTIGELFSVTCRASFGDARCKIDSAEHTVSGTVSFAHSRLWVQDSARTEVAGTYNNGLLHFTSGANSGTSIEVQEYREGGQVVLAFALPFDAQPGDGYQLTRGCNKTARMCQRTYDNIANFRGEPHVPGLDRMLETAGTRSLS